MTASFEARRYSSPSRAEGLLEQLEVEGATVVPAGAGDAVDGAEAAVGDADVEQVLQHPAGDPLVLGGRAARGACAATASGQLGQDAAGVGAGVEVHREGDQVDRVQRELGHLVDGVVGGLDCALAGVEVVQRRGGGQRLHPLGEAHSSGAGGGTMALPHARRADLAHLVRV